MFLLDSLMIAGLRWTLNTIATAADAERDDEASLREQLLEAVMQLQAGELDDLRFQEIERDLLARIREARARRSGGTEPIALTSGVPIGGDRHSTLEVEASLAGDFHEPPSTEPPDAVPLRAPAPAPSRRRAISASSDASSSPQPVVRRPKRRSSASGGRRTRPPRRQP